MRIMLFPNFSFMILILFLSNTCFADPIPRPQQPPPSAVKPSAFNGRISPMAAFEAAVSVPENYSLSFDITPNGIIEGTAGSIIHYNGSETNEGPRGRMPGIFCSQCY